MHETFDEIWSKYDAAAALPEIEQNAVYDRCLTELENVAEERRDDEVYYLKGYLLYMYNPARVVEAQAAFQKALEIYPENNGARLYLGHCLYDRGFYQDAEYHFSIVDKDVFNDFFRMKIEEMLVCCHLKTDGLTDETLRETRQLVNKYFKLNYLDDYLFSLKNVLKDHDIELDELALKAINFRAATREDLPEIVRMLADDFLGAQRERYEDPLPESYIKAFAEIAADKNNELIVAELDGEIVGALQLTLTPSISFQGGKRATVESVRVDEKYRGQGIGKQLMEFAIARARAAGCVSMQLTTNMDRADAHRFYEKLGFDGTHLGMKLKL